MQKVPVGLTRVSSEGSREVVHSYNIQEGRIRQDCAVHGWAEPLFIRKERNVSGGALLDNRPALAECVKAIQDGEANVLVAAYFDRFFRNLEVQAQVIRLVEEAGGEVWALDHGELTNATPGRKLVGNLIGAVAEYTKDEYGRRSWEGIDKAVADGKTPFKLPLGLAKDDQKFTVVTDQAPIALELFERRAAGHSWVALCRWLADEHGIHKTTTGLRTWLKCPAYRGRIEWGGLVNEDAHTAIIGQELWDAVRARDGVNGKTGEIEGTRLLSGLRVMRCGVCKTLMTVGGQTQNLPLKGHTRYFTYICGANPPHAGRQSIAAPITEEFVKNRVADAVEGLVGKASSAVQARKARAEAERLREASDGLIDMLTGMEDRPKAKAKLAEAEKAADKAERQATHLESLTRFRSFTVAKDRDRMTDDQWRALITDAVERIYVHPGRGVDRIDIRFRELGIE